MIVMTRTSKALKKGKSRNKLSDMKVFNQYAENEYWGGLRHSMHRYESKQTTTTESTMDNRKPNGNVITTKDHAIYKSFMDTAGTKTITGYVLMVNMSMTNDYYEIKFTDEPPVKEETKIDQIGKLIDEIDRFCAPLENKGISKDGINCLLAHAIQDGKFTNVKWVGK